MWRAIVVSGVILFSLCGCAAYPPASNYTNGPDPDGDGDSKGFGFFSGMIPATGNKTLIFDPNYNAWAVYNADGALVNTGRASGGKLFCPDIGRECKTLVGTFSVLSKGSADCISHVFPVETNGGAPMPYCMFFSDKGYAIHGSNDVPDRNASHGCVRVTPKAAQWLNENFLDIGSLVVVLPYE